MTKKINGEELKKYYKNGVEFANKSTIQIIKINDEEIIDEYGSDDDYYFDFGIDKEYDWGSWYYNELTAEDVIEYVGELDNEKRL